MSLLFAMFLSFNVAFATDNNDKKEAIATEKVATEVAVTETEPKAEPEGLYCSVTDRNGNSWSCWFCDCTAFVKAIKQN